MENDERKLDENQEGGETERRQDENADGRSGCHVHPGGRYLKAINVGRGKRPLYRIPFHEANRYAQKARRHLAAAPSPHQAS